MGEGGGEGCEKAANHVEGDTSGDTSGWGGGARGSVHGACGCSFLYYFADGLGRGREDRGPLATVILPWYCALRAVRWDGMAGPAHRRGIMCWLAANGINRCDSVSRCYSTVRSSAWYSQLPDQPSISAEPVSLSRSSPSRPAHVRGA